MLLETDLAAAEAFELHDFLTEHGIPDKGYSEEGKLVDEAGRHYYILPLRDRVLMFAERFAQTHRPTATSPSEVSWTPWNPITQPDTDL